MSIPNPAKGPLIQAKTHQRTLNKAERDRDKVAAARDAAILRAQQAGATYAQIEEATGLSTTRVTQILRRARQN